jgi:predicted HTH transcriptional regulator
VRAKDMDMTEWLEYFVDGLKNQMLEVKDKGELAIKKEIVVEKAKKLNLNQRQRRILVYLLEKKKVSVDEIRQKFNFVRRTIQRDLSRLVELGLSKEMAKSKTDPTKYYEPL